MGKYSFLPKNNTMFVPKGVKVRRPTVFKDSDGDGVADPFDCRPKNPRKQDLGAFTAGMVGSVIGTYLISYMVRKRRESR